MPPPDVGLSAVTSTVELWGSQRRAEAKRGFNRDGMRRFVETHNAQTRRLISLFQITDPDFYSALAELATNAVTQLTPGANLFAGPNREKMTDR